MNFRETKIGAKRILNEAFHETLLSLNKEKFEFTYSIDDGPGPASKQLVSNYIGKVSLSPLTDINATFIEWRSSFESAPENEVSEFCNPIYAGLLGALKAKMS